MCGIVGFVPKSPLAKNNLTPLLSDMAGAIAHRGPDDDGIYLNDEGTLGLGFRRLAILDLSPNGAQPMHSKSGRYIIVYNGEIYNFQELKEALVSRGHSFKGGSDTEVLLSAIEEWGFEKTLPRLNGMFAIALYDRNHQTLCLARDRVGKKPLYLGWGTGGFYITSELKAVERAETGPLEMNRDTAALYMHWRYIPDPYCIYKNFWKLKPGHFIMVPLERLKSPFNPVQEMRAYWSLGNIIHTRTPFKGSEDQALGQLRTLLLEAVKRRMIADVPLGVFLSGGIDSSLITALMAENSRPKTFTIGFDDPAYNEAPLAKEIATHLGTDHTEHIISANDALASLHHVINMLDEPFGDPSIIPTFQVCQLARQHMTVALSGDGGDELFGGYSWYGRAEKIAKIPCKSLLSAFLKFSPQQRKIASILRARSPQETYAALHSYAQTTTRPLLNFKPVHVPLPHEDLSDFQDNHSALMAYDTLMFMTGDVLTKVDRASMAHSLEVRNPLLDKDIIEFVWSLPPRMRRNKTLLKTLLRHYLPDTFIDRPKKGFSIPHSAWIRGPLREWAEDLLSLEELGKSGVFNSVHVHQIWAGHRGQHHDYGHLLWTILMFQSWRRGRGL